MYNEPTCSCSYNTSYDSDRKRRFLTPLEQRAEEHKRHLCASFGDRLKRISKLSVVNIKPDFYKSMSDLEVANRLLYQLEELLVYREV